VVRVEMAEAPEAKAEPVAASAAVLVARAEPVEAPEAKAEPVADSAAVLEVVSSRTKASIAHASNSNLNA